MSYSHIQYGGMYPVFDPVKEYEISLVNQWLDSPKGTIYKTTAGQSVFVVNPGIRNVHEGPDVYDAVLKIGDKIITGEIECHLDSGGWVRHGHHKQKSYQKVILHVVRDLTSAKDLTHIPTLILKPQSEKTEPVDCSIKSMTDSRDTIQSLHFLSEIRWQSHVRKILKRYPVDVKALLILSAGIFGAGRNKAGFIKLAENIDLDSVIRPSHRESILYLQQVSNELVLTWFKRAVRPSNQPETRFPAFVEFARWLSEVIKVKQITPVDIEKDFQNTLNPYCGKGFITELLGNVIYPFIGANAVTEHDIPLFNVSKDQWFELKLPYSYMKYQKQFQDLFSSSDLRSFSFLQGLKALDSHYCKYHYCKLCPLKEEIDDLF